MTKVLVSQRLPDRPRGIILAKPPEAINQGEQQAGVGPAGEGPRAGGVGR